MSNFQLGDRVMVKGSCSHGGFGGDVVELKQGPRGDVVVVDDNNGHRLAFHPDELEEAGNTTLSAPG